MFEVIIFNVSLFMAISISTYALWGFLRAYLLRKALDSHYDQFCSVLESKLEEDELLVNPAFFVVMESKQECFINASSLSAFSLANCSKLNLSEHVAHEVERFFLRAPEDKVIYNEIKKLKTLKVNTIVFYVKYCRLSGYLWLISSLIRKLMHKPVPDIRMSLDLLLDRLLDESTKIKDICKNNNDLAYALIKRQGKPEKIR